MWSSISSTCPRLIAIGLATGAVLALSDETPAPMTAEESDPNALEWMVGFPPPPEKLIRQPESDFFSFPKLRWTVCNFRQLMPTRQVSRGLGAPAPLETALDDAIDEVTFRTLGGDEVMTWQESLSRNYTDGILIMHEGKIVYERYFGSMAEDGQHAAMSVTKSLTGLLAEILISEGTLDDSALVSTVVPELGESAFGSATIRQVMDMTTALEYSEDYSDPNADVWIYGAAASPMPKPADYEGPRSYYEYLQTVRQNGVHGDAFHYKTINTDTLGWIIARATGKHLTDLLSERIWSRIGAEQDAYFTVDSIGVPFAGGGLNAGLRDMGRFGQLVLDEGVFHGERLFPADAVQRIRRGGSKEAFVDAGFSTLPGASYCGMWWVLHNPHGAFAARGVHGQTVYIDPTAQMVIVRFASFPVAQNSFIDPTSMPAYQAIAEYLMSK